MKPHCFLSPSSFSFRPRSKCACGDYSCVSVCVRVRLHDPLICESENLKALYKTLSNINFLVVWLECSLEVKNIS